MMTGTGHDNLWIAQQGDDPADQHGEPVLTARAVRQHATAPATRVAGPAGVVLVEFTDEDEGSIWTLSADGWPVRRPPATASSTPACAGAPARRAYFKLACEIVTNAVWACGGLDTQQRGTGEPLPLVCLWLVPERDGVLVLVWDSCPLLPERQEPGLDDDGGPPRARDQACCSDWAAGCFCYCAIVLLTGIVILAVGNYATLLGVPPSSPAAWALPGSYGAAAAADLAWGLVLRKRRPDLYTAAGLGASAVTARLCAAGHQNGQHQ